MPQRSKQPTVFCHNGVPHRIVRRHRVERRTGWLDPFDVHENILQRKAPGWKGWLGLWENVETETIPNDVMISLGCFGDTGGWTSRFLSRFPQAFA